MHNLHLHSEPEVLIVGLKKDHLSFVGCLVVDIVSGVSMYPHPHPQSPSLGPESSGPQHCQANTIGGSESDSQGVRSEIYSVWPTQWVMEWALAQCQG